LPRPLRSDGFSAGNPHAWGRPCVVHAHRHLLAEWARASVGMYRVVVTVEGLQFLTGFGLAAALLTQQVLHGDAHASALLLVY
jgi:hypothetical protein